MPAYDYIARHYGLRFKQGQRVNFTECGGKLGTVMRPMPGSEHYVRVKFDDGVVGNCHPKSLEVRTD